MITGSKRALAVWSKCTCPAGPKGPCPGLCNVFAAHARDSRPAFFGLNRVLFSEVAERKKRLADMQAFTKPVSIIFGAEEKNLNVGVARELDAIFPNSELHLIEGACHYVQLDAPESVARVILALPAS